MSRTSEQYRKALHGLAPQGLVWPEVADDSNLGKLWETIGDALLSLDNDSNSVLNDLFPDSVGTFLGDWSRVLGFPRFGFEDLTSSGQRDANLAWLNVNEFSNKQFFVDIAAILGFDIVVEDRDEDPTLGPFEFLITTSSDLPATFFRAGESRAGERLVNPGAQEPLEALIEFFAPAHTTPSFFYASNLIAEDGDNLIAEDGDNLIG
jgi:uncharacterized protein YmfQ (DUF2313 family)